MANDSSTATTAAHKLGLSCAVCTSGDVAGVCHHCALPFCAEHLPSIQRPWYRIDPEYRGLELAETVAGGAAIHCHRHSHQRFNWHPFYRSAAMFVFALLFPAAYLFRHGGQPTGALVGLFLLAAGMFMLAWVAEYRGEKASEPPLPLFGRSPSLDLREFVGGTVRLDRRGAYRAEVTRATGRIDFTLAPDGSEERRREALQRRYHLRSRRRLRTSAGFLGLRGKARLEMDEARSAMHEWRPHILALASPAEGHPFFPLDGAPQPYVVQPQYTFALGGGLPVRLLPALVSSENELGLELTVQLLGMPPHFLAGADAAITSLVLCAPPQLGDVRSLRPAAALPGAEASCAAGDDVPAVTWQNVELLQDAEAPPGTGITSGHHRTFFVRFARGALLPHATLTGSLALRIEQRLLSGLNGALLFTPLGWRRDDLTVVSHTELRLTFELSLASLAATAPLHREREREYKGPVSYRHVLELARQLNQDGHYVKRVVEHASAAVNRDDGRHVERAWTVAGRTYRGVYPVDFEINVSCPERRPRRDDGDIAYVQIRADARVSRGTSLAALGASTAELLTICDGVFGARATARQETSLPDQSAATPPDQTATPPPDQSAALPPGYGRPQQEPDRPPPGG